MRGTARIGNGVKWGSGRTVMATEGRLVVTGSSGLFWAITGFPHPHAALVPPVAVVVVVLVAVAAVAVVVLGLRRSDMMVLFPPCMFLMVAV